MIWVYVVLAVWMLVAVAAAFITGRGLDEAERRDREDVDRWWSEW